MSEMLTDLMNNIYARISQLGKSIQGLQGSLETLNKTLNEKTSTLVDSIKQMKEFVEKEGEAQNLVFDRIGQDTLKEIQKLQERIGMKDLNEVTEKLHKILESSEEALKPEIVDLLIHEVLSAVRQIKGEDVTTANEEGAKQLEQIGAKIASKSSSMASSSASNPAPAPSPTPAPAVTPPSPGGNPPPGSPPPGAKPPGMKPPPK